MPGVKLGLMSARLHSWHKKSEMAHQKSDQNVRSYCQIIARFKLTRQCIIACIEWRAQGGKSREVKIMEAIKVLIAVDLLESYET